MKRRLGRGFSLMELLVVMLIVAVLAGVAVARFYAVRDHSLVAAATFDLDLVRKMLAYYAADYDGYPQAVGGYEDLKAQMVDPEGKPYGRLPVSNTFTWVSYQLNAVNDYEIRVRVADRHHTMLLVTPDRVLAL